MIRQMLCGFILASTFASAAQAETYVCDIQDGGRNNTIPDKILIFVSPDGQSAEIVDPFTHYMDQAPKKASFFKNTPSLLRVRWVVDDMIFSNGGISDLRYSLVFRKERGRAHVDLTIPSFDNTDRGTGTCALEK